MALVIRSRCIFFVRFAIEGKQLERLRVKWNRLAEYTRQRGRQDCQEEHLIDGEPDETDPVTLTLDELFIKGQDFSDTQERAVVRLRTKNAPTDLYMSILETLWKAIVEPVIRAFGVKVSV